MIGLLLFLIWLSGYHLGKADGIREVRHFYGDKPAYCSACGRKVVR